MSRFAPREISGLIRKHVEDFAKGRLDWAGGSVWPVRDRLR